MRFTPVEIQQFLQKQRNSGQSVIEFCASHKLKVPTFYSWKRKNANNRLEPQAGFVQILPSSPARSCKLCLPSGICLDLNGLSIDEVAQVVIKIDRAHA